MEEQSSWKGHTFTLLVFAGIVFLCSIFFVLGMLIGQGQGKLAADAAASATASKAATAAATEAPHSTSEGKSAIAPYEGVETGRASNAAEAFPANAPATPTPEVVKASSPAPDPEPAKMARPVAAVPVPSPPPASVPKPVPPASPKMNYLQVTALGKESAAKKVVDDLNKQGFPALMMDGGADKLYHVQVGPFSNNTDEAIAMSKLVALGYKPFKK